MAWVTKAVIFSAEQLIFCKADYMHLDAWHSPWLTLKTEQCYENWMVFWYVFVHDTSKISIRQNQGIKSGDGEKSGRKRTWENNQLISLTTEISQVVLHLLVPGGWKKYLEVSLAFFSFLPHLTWYSFS